MTLYIDKKFVNLISASLEKFKWKKETLATCRCFKCGDSKKKKSKTRGYFFEHKGSYVYKCHNCGFSCGVYGVLEVLSPTLAKEYSFEKFKDQNPKPIEQKQVAPRQQVFTDLGTRLDLLNVDHKAIKYVQSREIPKEKYCNFYYCPDFGKIMRSFNREGTKEARLVIPFYNDAGELIGVQGRAIDPTGESIRYITLKRDGEE